MLFLQVGAHGKSKELSKEPKHSQNKLPRAHTHTHARTHTRTHARTHTQSIGQLEEVRYKDDVKDMSVFDGLTLQEIFYLLGGAIVKCFELGQGGTF